MLAIYLFIVIFALVIGCISTLYCLLFHNPQTLDSSKYRNVEDTDTNICLGYPTNSDDEYLSNSFEQPQSSNTNYRSITNDRVTFPASNNNN